MMAMRRLTKLTQYLLGTSEVYQELCPDPHAETLKVLFHDCAARFEHRSRVVRHWLRSN